MLKAGLQALAIWIGTQFIMGKIMGPKIPPPVTTTDGSGGVVTVQPNTAPIPSYWDRPESLDDGAKYSSVPLRVAPMWPTDSAMDIIIVVSPSFVHEPLDKVPKERIVVSEKAFVMTDKNEKRVIDTSFDVPKAVQNNGTLWGHFYIGLSDQKLDPSANGYDPTRAYHFMYPLTQYLPKKKVIKTKNLLGPANTTEESEVKEVPTGRVINSFYHPNFTFSFIPDSKVMNYATLHPAIRQYVHLDVTGARDGSGQNGWYYPMLFINTFWQLRSHMIELNSTITRLPFHVDLNTQANWLFSIISSMEEGNKQTQRQVANGGPVPAGGDGSEFEMFKEILLDSNVYLLITTAVVSVLHMVFEMLAFKNDIVRLPPQNLGIVLMNSVSLQKQERQCWNFGPLNPRKCLYARCCFLVPPRQ
jgi:Cleft lip and palate transmembrane protein 1 (CLPTM1)